MKKVICILITVLFALSVTHAQAPEKLTNTSIIKMAKANLSDDIILDEINASAVNFNMCTDSVAVLTNAHVSPQVIQAMKLASGSQSVTPEAVPAVVPTTSAPVETSTQAPKAAPSKTDTTIVDSSRTIKKNTILPDTLSKDSLQEVQNLPTVMKTDEVVPVIPSVTSISMSNTTDKDSIQLNALVYVAPVNELVLFIKQEFENFTGTLTGWDRQIRDSLEVVNRLNHMIGDVEKQLNTRKNADSKAYTQDIILMKKTLSDYRGKYKQLKTNLMLGGTKITKELKTISSGKIHLTGNKINDVANLVSSTNSNPANGENAVPITFIKQKINDQYVGYISAAIGLLVWYQNENTVLQGIIVNWNNKITPLLLKDTDLANKLKPLKSKLEEYKQNSKTYKNEISALKKQISSLEKERKLVYNQMDSGKKQLATYLKQHKVDVQNSLNERLNDLIDNIIYTYQEKMNI